MKLDALDHPKTLDFAARLNVSRPTAIGHLELLWAFAGKQSAQGNIGKWPDGAIARACDWMGAPEIFINALVDARFVDLDPSFRLTVHDWSDHAPGWVRAKLKKVGLSFIASSERSSETSSDEDIDGDKEGSSERSILVKRSVVKTSEGKRSENARQTGGESPEAEGKRTEGTRPEPPPSEPIQRGQLTPEATMAIELRKLGVNITSANPFLVAWVADAFTVGQLLGAVAIARESLGDDAQIAAKYLDKVLRDPKNWPAIERRAKSNGSQGPSTTRAMTAEELEDRAIVRAITDGRSDDEIAAMPDFEITPNLRARVRAKREELSRAEH